jgi:hypothetical protein
VSRRRPFSRSGPASLEVSARATIATWVLEARPAGRSCLTS